MLTQLYIENFILVDQLTIDFKSGLNIFTGETGAGKTIIIAALNAVLGERVTTDLIRSGAEKAVISGVFTVDNQQAREKLALAGIDLDSEDLLLQREIQQSGKHVCRINGRPTTLSMLFEIGRSLVDIHGQHQHQSLLLPQVQMQLLDRYGGLLDDTAMVRQLYQHFQEIAQGLKKLSIDESEKARQMSTLEFEVQEIDQARLQPGEDESIQETIRLLHHAQRLNSLASQSYDLLYETESAVYHRLYQVWKNLQQIAEIDPSVKEDETTAEELYYQTESMALKLAAYSQRICFDPVKLEECEGRLDMINKLKRKYGASIEKIIAYRDAAAIRLSAITHQEEEIARLQEELRKAADALSTAADELSAKREEAAKQLHLEIEGQLNDLAMKQCQFMAELIRTAEEGAITRGMRISQEGFDEVRFLICPNIGENFHPLAETASGGELSRIMLAIKGILARVDEIPTLVFDEIDTGVGGKTAQMVAEKLRGIAQSHQVICITHLPVIASLADHHLYVEKIVSGERTTTRVRVLDENERVHEIATMLGGGSTGSVSESSLMHAQELMAGRLKGALNIEQEVLD